MEMNSLQQIKNLLDEKVELYNHTEFIETDPIQIPHRFSKKEDIEIAGFLSATIAWGQRKSIIKNASLLMDLMDNSPAEFVREHSGKDLLSLSKFVHRTFNGGDCIYFIKSLQKIYLHHRGLENVFTEGFKKEQTIFSALKHFRNTFLELPHEQRITKHLSDVTANSSAKRLNMFLRWMVRSNATEVDFGLWKEIPSSALMLPLDVHTGDVSRALGILQRTQNDWKAVEEVTQILRKFDPEDPVKYDFALFGIGAFESKKTQLPII
jgi:uncharacterized protein (TIGR02757 family)